MAERIPEEARNKLLLMLLATPVVALWRTYALWILYGWFAVASLGLPALSLAQVFGVSLVIGLLTYRRQPPEPAVTPAMIVSDALFVPAFALVIGWIAKGFL